MLENLFTFTNQEFLFAISYGLVMISGVYLSLKKNVQPIFTLLLILSGSIVFLIITNLAESGLQQYLSDTGSYRSVIILFGIFGVLVAVKFLKILYRIPTSVIHSLLAILFIFFSFFQVNEYVKSNQYLSYLIFNFPIYDGAGSLNIDSLQQTASLFPGLFLNNTIFFELFVAILATLTYMFFSSKFKYPGNSLLFTIFILFVLIFISLFKINPAQIPALSDRIIGLNVVQWGLVLSGILLLANILSKEMNTSRRKRDILKKAPSEFSLLVIYLILTIFAFLATSIFSPVEIKILLLAYFITTGFMVSYFLKKIEKNYLRYGTVSIILLACILFTHSKISISGSEDIHDVNPLDTPQILIDKSSINDRNITTLHTNNMEPNSERLNNIQDPRNQTSISYHLIEKRDVMISEIIQLVP